MALVSEVLALVRAVGVKGLNSLLAGLNSGTPAFVDENRLVVSGYCFFTNGMFVAGFDIVVFCGI